LLAVKIIEPSDKIGRDVFLYFCRARVDMPLVAIEPQRAALAYREAANHDAGAIPAPQGRYLVPAHHGFSQTFIPVIRPSV
jgi:hypothetical protein